MGKKKNKSNILTQKTLQYLLDTSLLLSRRKVTEFEFDFPKSTKLFDITKHINSEINPYCFLVKKLINKHILISNNHQIRHQQEVKKMICKKCKSIRGETYFKGVNLYGVNKLDVFFGKQKYETKYNERMIHRCVCGSTKSYL